MTPIQSSFMVYNTHQFETNFSFSISLFSV